MRNVHCDEKMEEMKEKELGQKWDVENVNYALLLYPN